jgi:hypothetical protein
MVVRVSEIPQEPPTIDTFWRVFEALNPEQFQHDDVVLLFDDLVASNFTTYPYNDACTVDKDHGRIEIGRREFLALGFGYRLS